MVESAKVIFVGLLTFEDPALLHVVQGQTSGISVLQLLGGFPIFTAHLVMLLPSSVAFTDHTMHQSVCLDARHPCIADTSVLLQWPCCQCLGAAGRS